MLSDGLLPCAEGTTAAAAKAPATAPWRRHPLGTSHDCHASAVRPYGLVLTLGDDSASMVLVPPECYPGGAEALASIEAGTKLKVRMLDLDVEKSLLLGGLDPDFVKRGRPKFRKTIPAMDEGTVVEVRVRRTSKQGYAVTETEDGVLVLVALQRDGCPPAPEALPKANDVLRVCVKVANDPDWLDRSITKKLPLGASPFRGCALADKSSANEKRKRQAEKISGDGQSLNGGESKKIRQTRDAAHREKEQLRSGVQVSAVVEEKTASQLKLTIRWEGQRPRKALLDLADSFSLVAGRSTFDEIAVGDTIAAVVMDAKKKVSEARPLPVELGGCARARVWRQHHG
eukprot:scaffold8226_cov286-Pinguiococcus_pyrenoidosus.AAC.4